MFIKYLEKITDTKYFIGYYHCNPFDEKEGYKINNVLATKEQMEQEGKLIDVPAGVDINKLFYYNPVTNTIFNDDSSTPDVQPTQTLLDRVAALEVAIAGMMGV